MDFANEVDIGSKAWGCREMLLKSEAFAKFAVRNNNTNGVQYITPPNSVKRIWFYVLKMLAFCSRMISTALYLRILISAHKSQGVKFAGNPEYIQLDSYLDPSDGLTISEGVVISTNVIILSHDWSWLKRVGKIEKYESRGAYSPVVIGPHTFIGAGFQAQRRAVIASSEPAQL